MADMWDDPEVQAWARRCVEELAPMVERSAAVVSIVPRGVADVKFAVETGFALMMDKPLILCVMPGAAVPEHLRRAADAIVEYDPDDGEGTRSRIVAAMAEVLGE